MRLNVCYLVFTTNALLVPHQLIIFIDDNSDQEGSIDAFLHTLDDTNAQYQDPPVDNYLYTHTFSTEHTYEQTTSTITPTTTITTNGYALVQPTTTLATNVPLPTPLDVVQGALGYFYSAATAPTITPPAIENSVQHPMSTLGPFLVGPSSAFMGIIYPPYSSIYFFC